MQKKPSRYSPVAKGPKLRRVLRKHPEVQAMLRSLHLHIDVKSGCLVGLSFWPCPDNGDGPVPFRRRRRAAPKRKK